MFAAIYRKWLVRNIKKNKDSIVLSNNIPLHCLKNNIGRNCVINEDVSIYKDSFTVDDYSYINGGKFFYATIGKFCSIGYNVYVGSGEHYIDKVSTFPLKNKVGGMPGLVDFPEQKNSIICNDVWIGNNVTIKQGVVIGNGAILASGSVVTKDVNPYSIVGGVPARLIRYRFSEEIISKLQSICWWNWDVNRIKIASLANEFDNILEFVGKYYKQD